MPQINEIKRARLSKTKEIYIKKHKALLCASRLSIIDITERSNQPFEDEEGIISFNGEIYNYIEIKKELLKKNKISNEIGY